MRISAAGTISALFCSVIASIAMAQTPTGGPVYPPPGTILRQLFPKPTGANGYEDLVLAGEWARQSRALDAAEQEGATLTVKRRALSDPPVARALVRLRQGLHKPIQSPHTNIDITTLFPEFALFRNLARLLNVEQYVLLADGKVSQAIDSLEDGLKLGYVIQGDTLLGGLVGIAIDAIVLNRLARHLEQLSARDCERLVSLANAWLNLPDPAIAALTGERDFNLKTLAKIRSDWSRFPEMLRDSGMKEDGGARELEQQVQENPAALGQMIDQTSARIRAYYDSILSNLSLPFWERAEPKTVSSDSPFDLLFDMLVPVMSQATDRFAQEQAQVQLLGVHAAIRRYRWEYDRLPSSLEELRLGRLTIDPFTGQPLVYRRTGDTYELYSAGPFDRGSDEKPPSGERVPIYLPRKPR